MFNRKRRRFTVPWSLAAGAALAFSSACGGAESPEPSNETATEPLERPLVKTTCYPMDWLVSQLAGPRVERELIIPEGQDPVHWQPEPDVVAGLAEADLVVANGAGYEKWMETATLPPGKVVYTAEGLDLIERESVTHSHGVHGDHSHAAIDPHTWSEPGLFVQQAERVAEELERIDPEHSEAYDTALAQLTVTLEELSGAYEELFSEMSEEAALAANHPAYDYLARRYGFAIVSFELDPEEVSSTEVIEDVEEWRAEVQLPVMLWEELPTPAVEQSLPGDIRHVFVDPLEQPPEGEPYDYTGQAYDNIRRLSEALVVTD